MAVLDGPVDGCLALSGRLLGSQFLQCDVKFALDLCTLSLSFLSSQIELLLVLSSSNELLLQIADLCLRMNELRLNFAQLLLCASVAPDVEPDGDCNDGCSSELEIESWDSWDWEHELSFSKRPSRTVIRLCSTDMM